MGKQSNSVHQITPRQAMQAIEDFYYDHKDQFGAYKDSWGQMSMQEMIQLCLMNISIKILDQEEMLLNQAKEQEMTA